MVIPLVLLAFLSIFGGALGLSHAITGKTPILESFMAPALGLPGEGHHLGGGVGGGSVWLELGLMGLSLAIAVFGIWMGYLYFSKRPALAEAFVKDRPGLHEAALNKFYIDEIYHSLIVERLIQLNEACGRFDTGVIDRWLVHGPADAADAGSHGIGLVDNEVIDGAVNGVADIVMVGGQKARQLQTGNIKSYVTFAVGGALVLIAGFSLYFHWNKIGAWLHGLFGSGG
jgi:NADH-quinone oxidoreductase subunit L